MGRDTGGCIAIAFVLISRQLNPSPTLPMRQPTENAPAAHPGRLLNALLTYRFGNGAGGESDKRILRDAMAQHESEQAALRKPLPFYKTVRFAPMRSYQRYVRAHKSSGEAIAAHWQKVGEYLSFAIIRHALSDEEVDERRK